MDKVAWTGGSNLQDKRNKAPTDALCFRPENFREMQKQHDSLKQGLPTEQRSELGEGGKSNQFDHMDHLDVHELLKFRHGHWL